MAYINGVKLTENFLWEVARGNVPGYSMVNKFGYGNVGTSLTPVTSTLDLADANRRHSARACND